MCKKIFAIIVLFGFFFAPLLGASLDKVMRDCKSFNNACDVMSCMMKPLSPETTQSFEDNFNQLEREVLAEIRIEVLSARQTINAKLSELKSSRDGLFTRLFTGNKLRKIQALERDLADVESLISAKPAYRRAKDEITIVRDRLRFLRAELKPPGLLTVPSGSFKMGKNSDIDVSLRPFSVFETHVTQGEWKQLSGGVNPSMFKGNVRPVESISWASMVMYTMKLNDRLGLEQAIDLSQMDSSKFTGRWDNGTLNFKGEESKLRIDLKKTGYRLPTEAEWEYLARNLGESRGEYPHGLSESDLAEYSVYLDNSSKQTADVKSKKPLLIDGREIYDLMGNVWIGTLGSWEGSPLGGDNPVQLTRRSSRVIRGGCWDCKAGGLSSSHRYYVFAAGRHDHIGLRLVRTLP